MYIYLNPSIKLKIPFQKKHQIEDLLLRYCKLIISLYHWVMHGMYARIDIFQ